MERPADGAALVSSLLVAVGTDVAVRAGVAGVGGAALVAGVPACLLASRRVVNRQAQAAVLAAPLFGMWLAARSSPWLLGPDLLAAAGLLVLGCSFSRGGSLFDLRLVDLVRRAGHAALHGATGPAFVLGRARLTAPGSNLAVLRGLLLAAPLLVVLGLLLSSADAVFASFFRLSFDPVSIAVHASALVLGGWAMAGLLRLASAAPMKETGPATGRLGQAEILTVLACLDGLYAAFAVAQLVALSSGGQKVIRTAGLTYADYARSGFFQLLAVAVLTLAVLLALRAGSAFGTEPESGRGAGHRAFVLLAELAIGLTLVIVVVALRRLGLYEEAFGLTMLRLYSSLFALWIAVTFVLLGCVVAGWGRRRSWFVPATAGLALAGVLVLNAVNPEALVVRHNVAHAAREGRFDAGYATSLSADAVPTLVEALPRLDGAARTRALAELCAPRPRLGGWLAYNASADKAVETRNRVCQ